MPILGGSHGAAQPAETVALGAPVETACTPSTQIDRSRPPWRAVDVDDPSGLMTVAHRGGRRVSFIPPVSGPRASWEAVSRAATQPRRYRELVESASITCRVVDDGRRSRIVHHSAIELSDIEPDALLDVRRPTSYVGQSNFVGTITAPSDHWEWRAVWCESLLERSHYHDLLIALPVRQLATQGLRLEWYTPTGVRYHVPDALALLADGTRLLCDVTTLKRFESPRVRSVFDLTAATCEFIGWDYEVRVEMPAQRARNVRFLRAFRQLESPRDERARARWRNAQISVPVQIHPLARSLGDGDVRRGLIRVWHLLSEGMVHADLSCHLRPETLVYPGRSGRSSEGWVFRP